MPALFQKIITWKVHNWVNNTWHCGIFTKWILDNSENAYKTNLCNIWMSLKNKILRKKVEPNCIWNLPVILFYCVLVHFRYILPLYYHMEFVPTHDIFWFLFPQFPLLSSAQLPLSTYITLFPFHPFKIVFAFSLPSFLSPFPYPTSFILKNFPFHNI